jgi:hypothetical protein
MSISSSGPIGLRSPSCRARDLTAAGSSTLVRRPSSGRHGTIDSRGASSSKGPARSRFSQAGVSDRALDDGFARAEGWVGRSWPACPCGAGSTSSLSGPL